jgi:hypothetical protein
MAATVYGRGWTRLAAPGAILVSPDLLAGCVYYILAAAEPSGSAGMLASQAAALLWVLGARCRRYS